MELESAVKSAKADIGLALDGDSDRMALVDDNGRFIPTHKALVISLIHHAKNRGMKFRFVKTISGTSLLNIIAKVYGVEIIETPVGFKHIGDLIIKDSATIGGEESGGLGAILDADEIPIHADAIDQSRTDGIPALDHALHDGEDFELCVVLSAERARRLLARPPEPVSVYRVGEITAEPGLRLRRAGGVVLPLEPRGFDHFRNRASAGGP